MVECLKMKNFDKNPLFEMIVLAIISWSVVGIILYANPQLLSNPISPKNIQGPAPTIKVSLPTTIESPSPTIEIKTPTSDPIVKCILNECGTVEMKSSQCRISGCCVLKNENKVMTDQSECIRLKALENSQGGITTTTSKELILKNAQNNANSIAFQICMDNSKIESDKCFDDCMAEANQGSSICNQAADGLGWETDKYSECLNDSSAIHDSCTDKCLNESQIRGNECLEKYKPQ